MNLIADILIVFFVVAGVIFTIVTVVGILRLPDAYTRAHAASKSATLGVLSILLGVFLHFWWHENHFSVQLLLGIIFLFITSPIGGHLMSRAAYVAGVKPSELTVGDELKDVLGSEQYKQKTRVD